MIGEGTDIRTWPGRLGVKPGDTVQLMADLTRIAWNARRAGGRFSTAAFLDSFAEAVAPGGDILVPAYNFDLRSGDAFDLRGTPSISGALANAALGHAGYRRTPHPLHSFAVRGAHAEQLAASKEPGSFGPSSPFAFLLERKAVLLAIDLPLNDALTFVHFTEERMKVPYRAHRSLRIRYTGANGRTAGRVFSIYAKRPGHSPRQPACGAARSAGRASSAWTWPWRTTRSRGTSHRTAHAASIRSAGRGGCATY